MYLPFSSILAMRTHAHQQFGQRLLKQYAPSGLVVSSNAPSCVDPTVEMIEIVTTKN